MAFLCAPAMLNLILNIVAETFVFATRLQPFSRVSFLVDAALIIFSTWFLNYLCSVGYRSVAWGLFLAQFVLGLLGLAALSILAKQGG